MKRATSWTMVIWAGLAVAVLSLGLAGCGDDGGGGGGCGDGTPELPETCDDGNTTDGDGCSSTCQIEHGFTCWGTPSHCAASCGDGMIAATEACDDGNSLFMDGCGADCQLEHGFTCEGEPSVCSPVCGDGSVQTTEACDDGNTADGDGCSSSCEVEPGYVCPGIPSQCHGECGNGGMTPDEECDDGNLDTGDGCSDVCDVEPGWTCTGTPSSCFATCGDGIAVGTEPCDDGGESATCNDDCTVAACGDAKHNATAGEDCDDGGESANCDADCTLSECGDGDVNAAAGETCDDGNTADGDGCAAGCAPEAGYTCTGEPSVCNTSCGDGVTAGTEECDDSGESATCDANCTFASCGDGTVNATAGETCDDGGTGTGDGCDDLCLVEFGYACTGEPSVCQVDCGDGIVYGGEECDDGGETATCDGNCTFASCGDGDLNFTAGETCDDGNTVSGDGCDASCQAEYVLYVDPVANGHTLEFDGSVTSYDDTSTDVTLPFSFPYWNTSTTTATTSLIGFGTNGGLKMGGGYTTYNVIPLWTFSTTGATIHPHGADGYVGTASRMYSYTDATMAVFTWVDMSYCCSNTYNWSTQVVLYPSGNFSIYQISASSDTSRLITIGLSDGQTTDNAVAGANNLDWDTQTIGAPFTVGQVDFGSSEAGGMATGRHLLFEYNAATGYTCTVNQ